MYLFVFIPITMRKTVNRNACRGGGGADAGWGRLRRPGALSPTNPLLDLHLPFFSSGTTLNPFMRDRMMKIQQWCLMRDGGTRAAQAPPPALIHLSRPYNDDGRSASSARVTRVGLKGLANQAR